jgi:hypothetical protein
MADTDAGPGSPADLAARAARVGRRLSADQLAEMAEAMTAVEPAMAALRSRPIALLADGIDPAAGDAWLRPGRGRS